MTERLFKAASLLGVSTFPTDYPCGKRRVVADIGCDHAYLSIYLIEHELCDEVIAADLREGPLASAKENICIHGLSDRIKTVLTDGLDGLERFPLTDIVICGMGGDTMINILSRTEILKSFAPRLILQPQTAFAELSYFLESEGYHITAERYALEKNKPYRILSAEKNPNRYDLSPAEALLGRLSYKEDTDAYQAFGNKILNTLDKKIQGAMLSGNDPEELYLLRRSVLSLLTS